MGYVTVQQLIEKYGSAQKAARAYLEGRMTDGGDEEDCINLRVKDTTIIMARLDLIDEKLDQIRRDIVLH